MLTITVDRQSDEPIPAQVAVQIRTLISDGHWPAGERLPASRALAAATGVGRNSIVAAYEQLTAEGWVESGVGRGTFVAADAPTTARPSSPRPAEPITSGFSWDRTVARRSSPTVPVRSVAHGRGDGGDMIRLAGAVPDPSTYPSERMRKVIHDVLRREGADALAYGPPAGYASLREVIATRTTQSGAPVRPDDVLIVAGSQQGLDLIGRLMIGEGDSVLVEAPTYSNALQIWRLYGARVVGVPMDEDGLSPTQFGAALRRVRAKFVYVMPTFQNPTGLSMDEPRRREIMRIAREAEVGVIEDHFDADLRYSGVPVPPLRAYDTAGQVILLGTFSKMLFPGLRVGWIIAPREVRERLLEMKLACDLATSLPAQMALAEFCVRGELDRHLEKVRKLHAGRLRAMLDAIDTYFPENISTTRPQGGMTLWCTLPDGGDALEILEMAEERGLSIAPGVWFFPDGDGRRHFRLSFVGEGEDRIRKGIEILGSVIRTHLARRRAPRRREGETAPFL